MAIKVRYGIPKPTDAIKGSPEFLHENVTAVRLQDFPENIQPSGGMSNKISASEMYMVQTCAPTRMTWRQADTGRVLADVTGMFSFIGRFPWEITMPGMFFVDLQYNGKDIGFVEFEVQ